MSRPFPAYVLPALALALTGLSAPVHAQDTSDPAAAMRGVLEQAKLDAAALSEPDAEGPVLVSIDFAFEVPQDAFAAEMEGSAPFLAEMPGLIWKVWGQDAEAGRATGAYLFASLAAADAYVSRIFPGGPPRKEGYRDFDIVVTRVMDAPSRATRAPLD